MPPTLKELREKQKPLADRLYQMRDSLYKDDKGNAITEPRAFTKDEQAEWDKADKAYEALGGQIKLAERTEQITKELREPADPSFDPRRVDYDGRKEKKKLDKQTRRDERTKERQERRQAFMKGRNAAEDQALLLQAWMRVQEQKSLKRQHEWAIERSGFDKRKLASKEFAMTRSVNDAQVRAECLSYCTPQLRAATQHLYEARAAQALNINTAGGYLVPEGFVQNLEIALLLYSNIRIVADVMRTNSGQDLPWPAVNDTFQKGQILVENAQVTNTGKDVVFSNAILHAYKYTSNLILIPVELLEDSAFDLASLMGQLLGIRIARIQNDHMTFGTGVAQPTGLLTAAVQGVQAASPTALAWDDFYKLKHAVDPAYRAPGMNASWMFHDQILGFLKRLKDGAGRYLFQSGVSSGVPDTIDGDPYTINQSMASAMASGNKTAAYGAMKKLKVRDVTQVRLRRLVERYADLDQEGYVMFARFDCTVLDAGTHPIQYLIH